MPNLVPADRLETANQLSLATAFGITPVLGDLLVAALTWGFTAVFGPTGAHGLGPGGVALYFNAATFLANAMVVWFGIREIGGRPASGDGKETRHEVLRVLLDGWAYVSRTPLVRGLAAGILVAFAGAGAVIGTALAPHLAVAVPACVGIGAGAGMALLAGTTLLGGEVTDEVRGRVFAFVQTGCRVTLLLSIFVASVLVGVGGSHRVRLGGLDVSVSTSRVILLVTGVAMAAVGAFALRHIGRARQGRLRRRRHRPSTGGAEGAAADQWGGGVVIIRILGEASSTWGLFVLTCRTVGSLWVRTGFPRTSGTSARNEVRSTLTARGGPSDGEDKEQGACVRKVRGVARSRRATAVDRGGDMDVLIVYATRNGSTRQVAEAVAGAVRECGAEVELTPARTVRGTVAGRDLVVLGAPLYSGRWHRDAHRFLRRHRRELAAVSVAVFAMGPREDTVDAWHRSYAQLDRALGKHRWLQPVASTVFGGVDPPSRVHPRRDLRDWPGIRRWAAQRVDSWRSHDTAMHITGDRGPAAGEQPDGDPG